MPLSGSQGIYQYQQFIRQFSRTMHFSTRIPKQLILPRHTEKLSIQQKNKQGIRKWALLIGKRVNFFIAKQSNNLLQNASSLLKNVPFL